MDEMTNKRTARNPRPRCACGKAMSKNAARCKACDIARREARVAAVLEVVRGGKCPQCGSALRRNLSLTGWWQCAQYGADTHRADPSRPACSWQDFTA